MSESNYNPIENAAEIIDIFGGIRPMSTKTGVPVTTIQGWKKRNVIPANRVEDVLKAAKDNNLDLSSFIESAVAESAKIPVFEKLPEPVKEEVIEQKLESHVKSDPQIENKDVYANTESEPKIHSDIRINPEITPQKHTKKTDEFAHRPHHVQSNDFTQIAIETEKKAITKSAVVTFAAVLCVLGALGVMLMPKMKEVDQHGDRIASLESDVSDVQEQQSMFKGLMPENWNDQIDQLKSQMNETQASVEPALEEMRRMSADILGGRGQDVAQRVEKLEDYVSEISSSTSLSSMFAKLQGLEETVTGSETVNSVMTSLSDVYASLGQASNDPEKLNEALDVAREKDPKMAALFAGVPQKDLQAAAMLLAMSQVRSSLNRNQESFDSDLEILLSMVDENNIELKESLMKLAPYAKDGVLTPSGLSDEFRTLAGDVVASSLSGEDVSIMEKAQARMNDFIEVEKDGQLMTGTHTQATVKEAQKQLDEGNVEVALNLLKEKLNAHELAPIKPWIDKAQATLSASKVKDMIDQAIELNLGTGYLGGSQLLGR